jgi:hypothetical protein
VTKPPQTPSYAALARSGGDIAGSILSPFAADLLCVKTQFKPTKKTPPLDLELHINPLGIGSILVMGAAALWLQHIQLSPVTINKTIRQTRNWFEYWYPGTDMYNMVYKGKKYTQAQWSGENFYVILGLPKTAATVSTVITPDVPWKGTSQTVDAVFEFTQPSTTLSASRRPGFLEGYGDSKLLDLGGDGIPWWAGGLWADIFKKVL